MEQKPAPRPMTSASGKAEDATTVEGEAEQ
jgi:hypothetical protein